MVRYEQKDAILFLNDIAPNSVDLILIDPTVYH